MFDTYQNLQMLQSRYSGAKAILIDSGRTEQEIAYLLVNYTISGIISPDAGLELFYKAIRVVTRGDIWIDQKHLKSQLQRGGALTGHEDINRLSDQNKTIVRLISQGRKNREIGDLLCFSEHTIMAHVSRIYKRLNVSNRAQLASLAKEYFTSLHKL